MTSLPVMAAFPPRRSGVPRLSDDAASLLRTRLAMHRSEDAPLVVIIAGIQSSVDQEGVAVGLAETFARIGEATLLIDADLRHARASAWLEVSTATPTPYDDASISPKSRTAPRPISIVVGTNRAFDFLPAYPSAPQPVDRLVQAFRDNRDEWARTYDVIIVDAAPVFPSPDVLAVAPGATGVVLCARSGHTTRRDLDDAVSLLVEQGVALFGTVLTRAPRRPGSASRASAMPLRPNGKPRGADSTKSLAKRR